MAQDAVVEPLVALIMRALDESGRGTEAVRYFAAVRRQLVDELGVEPGQDLRELHRAILIRNAGPPRPSVPRPPSEPKQRYGAEQRLGAEPPPTVGRGLTLAGPPVPAQLPPTPFGFTGRRARARPPRRVAVPGRPDRPVHGGDLGRTGGRQDRPGDGVGARAGGRVPGRAALRGPQGLRPRPAGARPRRARPAPARHRRRGGCRPISPAGRPGSAACSRVAAC